MSSQLFIELYLDEDVDVLAAKLLRSRGFVAVTTQEAGLSGSTDGEQFSRAISERKTLLTHTLKLPERLLPARNTEGSSLH